MLMGNKVCPQDNIKTAAHTRNLLNILASIHVGVGIAGRGRRISKPYILNHKDLGLTARGFNQHCSTVTVAQMAHT